MNREYFEKSIDKSKNKLEIITDKNGHAKKVWKHIESGESKEAGKNAGKAYERSGKRHISFNGFNSGDDVSFLANGKEIKGIFRHVNESKHSTVAVIRGEDGKLYERGIKKISKIEEDVKPAKKYDTSSFKSSSSGLTKEQIASAKKQYDDVLNDLSDKLNSVPTGKLGLVDEGNMSENELKNYKSNMAQYNRIHKQFAQFNGTIPKKTANEMAMESRAAKTKYKTREEFEAANGQKSDGKNSIKIANAEVVYKNRFGDKMTTDIRDMTEKEIRDYINGDIISINEKKSKETLIEPMRAKTKIGIGDNTSIAFTDKSKQAWQRGDSVTFESKSGQQKVGRVWKVDDDMKMTTIRLANGVIETVNNKKIIN